MRNQRPGTFWDLEELTERDERSSVTSVAHPSPVDDDVTPERGEGESRPLVESIRRLRERNLLD